MDMVLIRTEFREDGIFGILMDSDGVGFECRTLEHAYGQNGDGWAPKLPPGEYTCVKGMHTLEHHPVPFEAFEVMNVPGHVGILFHIGNFNNDSDGCILLGMDVSKDPQSPGLQILSDSKETFAAFMTVQGDAITFHLTVEEELMTLPASA